MTATEKAKRAEALFNDRTKRELADMVVHREADLEDARAENAALREECDGWKKLCVDQEVVHVMHEDALDNENAKLRELVSELWVSCPVHDSDCDECQHKGGRTGCELYDRMRELGVEV